MYLRTYCCVRHVIHTPKLKDAALQVEIQADKLRNLPLTSSLVELCKCVVLQQLQWCRKSSTLLSKLANACHRT
jgi:hypothetical protein